MNKKYYIYFVLMGIFLFVSIFLVYEVNIKEKKDKGYLILPGNLIYYKDNDQLKRYTKSISKQNDINIITNYGIEKATFIYQNNQIKFYQNKEEIDFDEQLMYAYSSGLDLETIDFNIQELNTSDIQKIDSILKENDIMGYENLNEAEKITFDFDEDGINEEVYFISNLFDETTYNKVFSFVFMIQNDKVSYLLKKIDITDNAYNLCIPTPNAILKIDNYKLVVRCDYFSEMGSDSYLYEKNATFELVDE